jgi:hypothetical protein
MVWMDCVPDSGAPLPPPQLVERKPEGTMQGGGNGNRVESGQMRPRADL